MAVEVTANFGLALRAAGAEAAAWKEFCYEGEFGTAESAALAHQKWEDANTQHEAVRALLVRDDVTVVVPNLRNHI